MFWALAALASGLLLGVLLNGSTAPWAGTLMSVLAPVGQLWVAALQMVVVPLVVTQIFVAIVGARGPASIGRLGGKTLFLFVAMLVAAGILTLILAPPLISLYPVNADTAASLRAGVSIPNPAPENRGATGWGSWLVGLVPRNLVQAAASGEILPILLFTVFFALAAVRLEPDRRDLLNQIARGLADATMTLVGWVLKITPFGVFAISLELAARAGLRVAAFLGAFVAIESGLMLLFAALLYPVTAVVGRTSILRFARAVAPAQLVAASTRSSLASLPALVEGAKRHLALPSLATGFVLPLSVSSFKVNRTISGTVRLLFLAHVFQVHLSLEDLVKFVVTVILLSFSAVGIPNSGVAFRTLPAYLAAGVPLEGVMILGTVEAIPDIFKTLTNVTADMSAATILSRVERTTAVAEAGEVIA